MKKIKNLLFLGVILFLASCSNNESNSTITDADLIGSWSITDFHSENGSITATQNGISFSTDYSTTGSNFNAQMIFGDNPKIITGSGTFTMTASYTILGQTITNSEDIDASNAPSIAGANWSLDDGNIILSINGENAQAEIVSFDGNTLQLKTSLDKDVDEQGINGSITGSIFITLTK